MRRFSQDIFNAENAEIINMLLAGIGDKTTKTTLDSTHRVTADFSDYE